MWLTPCEPLRATLRSIVRRLASSLDAVEFEPHVTVFCGRSSELEARGVVDLVAGQFSRVELIADRLAYTGNYTKSLFVQFQESAVLRRMFGSAARAYSQPSDYVLSPHLSLLYKKLPAAEQQKLCETLDVPMGAYRFDRIQMIETELPIEDSRPVRRWRTVSEAPLAETE